MFLSVIGSKLRLLVRASAWRPLRAASMLSLLVLGSALWLTETDSAGRDLGPMRPSIPIPTWAALAEDFPIEERAESMQRRRPLRVVVAHWAAITDQRRDVLDLQRGDVVRVLIGDVRDWFELGGSPRPISVYLPRSQVTRILEAFGLAPAALAAEPVADHELLGRVAQTPGAFALIEPRQLRLGVLALTVDGHDPYRDPGRESPLRLLRWLPAPRSADELPQLFRSVRAAARPFDPAGLLITGELIPVRCTNHVLAALDDYDAMFDGVRQALTAADLTVAPLEHPLIAGRELTPCVETVIFSGSHRAVAAMANAGIDVVLTIGNHMMDCWQGCSGAAALEETLDRLHQAGIATAGAGGSLDAARAPALLTVETRQGPVRFAFLGYDIIAPWYHAGEDSPGTAPLEAEYLRSDLAAAREDADHVLVGVNWGVEYQSQPIAYQRELGGIAMAAGATVSFGNHPHWVQAVEHFDDALVAYSFGNFIFDQSWSTETTQGMLMELGFTRERLLGYRIRPVVIRAHSAQLPWRYRPEFVDPTGEGRAILDRIWQAQDRLPERPLDPERAPGAAP